MVGVRESVPGLLRELQEALPIVAPNATPLFEDLSSIVLPVIDIGLGPLAANTIRTEILFNQVTLGGGEDSFFFITAIVPEGEVHRYHHISFEHNAAGIESVQADIRYLTATNVTRYNVCRVSIDPTHRYNLLGGGGLVSAVDSPIFWNSDFLDIYPGGQFELRQDSAFPAAAVVQLGLFRRVMVGPRTPEPNNATADLTVTTS